jgi:predicted Ser/Thr protein kinase
VSTHIQRLRQEIASASVANPASQLGTRAAAAPQQSRYELLEELGRGGMGVVYKARDRRLGRIVALKRLPENLKHHPQAVALFEREARAAAALNHRNIVTLFDAGEENGTYFLSMELLEGRPLNAILTKSGRLRPGDERARREDHGFRHREIPRGGAPPGDRDRGDALLHGA